MYCKKCGNEVIDGAKFCNKCGAQIDQKTKEKRVNISSYLNMKHVMLALAIVGIVFCVVLVGKILKPNSMEIANEGNSENGYDAYNTEEEKPSLTSAFADAKQGNILTFGTYEQDNNLNNGKEPIEWIVLRNENNKLLVVSKYVLELQYYNNTYLEPVTWEESDIRTWLNGELLNNSFSEEEKDYILNTNISNPNINGVFEGRSNQLWESYGGNDTTDQIFLLSVEEIENYASAYASAQGTAYALSRYEVLYQDYKESYLYIPAPYVLTCNTETGYMDWWTRSPGTPLGEWPDDYDVKAEGYSDEAEYVPSYGSIKGFKESSGSWQTDDYAGVRPAMWIEIRE